jgi:hypothetical protein
MFVVRNSWKIEIRGKNVNGVTSDSQELSKEEVALVLDLINKAAMNGDSRYVELMCKLDI